MTEATFQPTPVVHIGLPKTATKTLQWRLFAEHPDIFYLGRFDGPDFRERYGQFGACRDAEIFRIMDAIAYRGVAGARVDTAAHGAALRGYLAAHAGGRVPVWSWESYSTDRFEHRRQRARNVREVFGEAKILVTVRHPLRLLESAFMQQLRRDNIGARYRRGRPVFFAEIDDWIRRDAEGEVGHHLDYANTIRLYAETFGQANVCVLVFEQLREDRRAFVQQLCEFCGITFERALELISDNVDNPRWTEHQLQRLAAISASPLRSLRYRYATRSRRRELLDLTETGDPRSAGNVARPRVGQLLRGEVVERTRAGNAWLQHSFGIDLEHYGYMRT